MKFFDVKKIVFLAVSLLFFVFAVTLKILGLYFINDFFNLLFFAVCFVTVLIWSFLIVRYKAKKTWVKITAAAICILLCIVMLPYMVLFNALSEKLYYEESSPSGKNSVVVMKGGFLDAVYYAYPKVAGMFYKPQDNGHVSKHDLWGGADIEIE